MLTEERLREIQARYEAATPGKWRHTFKDCLYYMSSEFIDREDDPIGVGLITSDINQHNAELYATDADMEFIAHARADIPDLLAEVRRLQADRDYLLGVQSTQLDRTDKLIEEVRWLRDALDAQRERAQTEHTQELGEPYRPGTGRHDHTPLSAWTGTSSRDHNVSSCDQQPPDDPHECRGW